MDYNYNKENLVWSNGKVTYEDRFRILRQRGIVVWFTGISGSGKSTISIEVENELTKKGILAYRLDGDNVRHGLCSDLGFSEKDRNENIRRVAETAALFKDAGIVTLVSFISPYKKMREFAKAKAGINSFIEVYVKADLETCKARDPKGLYKKALCGEVSDFTAISSPYEEPLNPDVVIDTTKMSLSQSKDRLIQIIGKKIQSCPSLEEGFASAF